MKDIYALKELIESKTGSFLTLGVNHDSIELMLKTSWDKKTNEPIYDVVESMSIHSALDEYIILIQEIPDDALIGDACSYIIEIMKDIRYYHRINNSSIF